MHDHYYQCVEVIQHLGSNHEFDLDHYKEEQDLRNAS